MADSIELLRAADGAPIVLHRNGSGETLLLVHGWTLDRRSFDAQAPLAKQFELVTFDRRGCGESTAAPNLAAEPADIDRIIEHLGGEPVHLLGVSQGARVALRFAVQHPGKLRSLILQGAVIDGYDPGLADEAEIPLVEYRELALLDRLDELRRRWLAHPLMSSETLTPEQSATLVDMVSRYNASDLLGPAPAAGTVPDLLGALAGLELPVLLITGARETAARRANAQKLLETLPDCREVLLEDCGHLSNFSRPAAYNHVVQEFIRAVSPVR
jgi:pimeloyl-ACP methyl ester carboxylesterase